MSSAVADCQTIMRNITAGLFIAVDGQLGAADTILLGRKTYDSFAGAWPDREAGGDEDAEFATKLGDTRKIVVSRQNLQFTWRNSEQIKAISPRPS
jgi:dihydrofolate reductase